MGPFGRLRVLPPLAVASLQDHLRRRLLASAVLVAGLCVLVGLLAANNSIYARSRLVVDVGLSAASLVGTALAAASAIGTFSGAGRMASEYTLLTRPIGRAEWLLGHYVGLALLLAAFVAVVAGGTAAGCLLAHDAVPLTLLLAAWQTAVELWLTLAVAFAFAAASAPPLAATLFAGLFLAGQLTGELELLTARLTGPAGSVATALLTLVPDYARLSLRDFAGSGLAVPAGLVWQATAYGLTSTALWLVLACLIDWRRTANA